MGSSEYLSPKVERIAWLPPILVTPFRIRVFLASGKLPTCAAAPVGITSSSRFEIGRGLSAKSIISFGGISLCVPIYDPPAQSASTSLSNNGPLNTRKRLEVDR